MTTIAEKTESGAKAEHTPTPWKLNGSKGTIFADPEGAGRFVNGSDVIIPHIAYIARNSCAAIDEEQKANAEFILRACNSFDELTAEVEKLRAFKAYVHQRLDDAGIPADPDSPHKAEGCRIGGRLDIVLKQAADAARFLAVLREVEWRGANYAGQDACPSCFATKGSDHTPNCFLGNILAKTRDGQTTYVFKDGSQLLSAAKSARAVLSNLAQSDPTYEPAWRGLTDAIAAAEGTIKKG